MSNRRLTFTHLLFLGLNGIIGMGIYLVPGELRQSLGNYALFAFPIGAVFLLPVGLTLAYLATRCDRNGAAYQYAAMTFGKDTAFIVGWVAWMTSVSSAGAVAASLGEYLTQLSGQAIPVGIAKSLPVAIILFFGLLNHRGIHIGALAMSVISAIKIIPVALLAFAALGTVSEVPLPTATLNLSGWHQAMGLVLFSYSGFEAIPILSGETRSATRAAPMALLLSLGITATLYTLIQWGVNHVAAENSLTALVTLATTVFGPASGRLIAVAGVVSIVGFVSGVLLAAPRYLEPIAQDGHLPLAIAKHHPVFHTPTYAILCTTLATAALVLFNNTAGLMEAASLSVAIQFALCSLVAIRLLPKKDVRRLVTAFLSLGSSGYFIVFLPSSAWIPLLAIAAFGLTLRFAKSGLPKLAS